MKPKLASAFTKFGGISFISGVVILVSFSVLPLLPSLRGIYVTSFLAYFLIAGVAYGLAVSRLGRDKLSLKFIWGLAIIFRVILLLTSPTLSDDVYRYVWDGHLLNQGINPYALPVNSPLLDAYGIPLRAQVNHAWMASPYLPTAQLIFGLVSRLASQSVVAFQITAVAFDLLTGWLVMDLLKYFKLPRSSVLLYLWNPLIILEFAHGAHIDSLMIFLMMGAFWLFVKSGRAFHRRAAEREQGENNSFWQHCSAVLQRARRSTSTRAVWPYASAIIMAAATLTKPLPVLLVPLFLRRWRWKGMLIYTGIILGVLSLFATQAGWGVFGQLDGTGIFGATRIYFQYWNYNSGIYHWLEVVFSGYQTPGAVPIDVVGQAPILLAKATTTGLLCAAILFSAWLAWRSRKDGLATLRLALISLGAYILLTPTVHPWYPTLIIPLLSFLIPQRPEMALVQPFIWPWIYFSIAVAFSYLTYYDPENLREYSQVRLLEYLPTYVLLAWAFLQFIVNRKKSAALAV